MKRIRLRAAGMTAGYIAGFFLLLCSLSAKPRQPGLTSLSAASGVWSIVSSPNIGSGGNYLNGVSCVSSNDCWAVGAYFDTGNSTKTLTLHWNGGAWSIVQSPNFSPAQNNNLASVACISSSNCWAIGEYFASNSRYQTLIEHWDGNAWTLVTSPNTDTNLSNIFKSVTCATPNGCWATGYYQPGAQYQPLIERWDGSSWSIAMSPVVTNGTSDLLFGAACTSASDCWTVGEADLLVSGRSQTLTVHWDGSSWSSVTSANTAQQTNSLQGVACSSSSDCWAVGDAEDTSNFILYTLIEHWDGTAWNVVPSPNPTLWDAFSNVTCNASNDCWSVGYQDTDFATQTLIAHWDGSSWNMVASPNSDSLQANLINSVACSSASDCWAVGVSDNTRTLIEHFSPNEPLSLLRVGSRKDHGPAAGIYTVGLPLVGKPGIECRTGDPQIVFTFSAPIAGVAGVRVTPAPGGTASVSGTPMIDGNQVTVTLTNVSNAQTLQVSLSGVSDSFHGLDASVGMSVLAGDTNGDGVVNSADIGQTKSQSGSFIGPANFREDINVDGQVDSADIGLVKSKSGTALP